MTSRFSPSAIQTENGEPPLLMVGVDHQCAPLDLREKVAYGADQTQELLRELHARKEISEACLLSTCNRTEIYLLPQHDEGAYRLALERVLTDRAPEIEAQGRFYVKRGAPAARHLLEVACGLRSMVLGEPEILGQVKAAFRYGETAVSLGAVLRRLLRSASSAGGRARRETAISSGAVSFGYTLADLARQSFGPLDQCSVWMLGAGEVARQVARNLIDRGVGDLAVSNRSARRAEEMRCLFPKCRLLPLAESDQALATVDLVVAITSSGEPVLRRDDLERAMIQRQGRPLLVADLGVPRNVEAEAGALDGLLLQDVDSLEEKIAQNLQRRRKEVPQAHAIVDRELELFLSWYRALAAEPLVEALQKRAEDIRRQEVESARDLFPPDTHADLDRLTRSLVRKILHHPSQQLRSARGKEARRLKVARDLFQLDSD